MDSNRIAFVISDLVRTAPPEVLNGVIQAIENWDDDQYGYDKSRLLRSIHNPQIKSKIEILLGCWGDINPRPSSIALALSIRSALVTFQATRTSTLELIWTGPSNISTTMRRTDQALLELINGATTRLIIVSFAVYKVRAIVDALEKAIQRNVEVIFILEDPIESQGKISLSGINAFSDSVFRLASFYTWPIENRPLNVDGKYGSLHAKLAVADQKKSFISSANLTDYAMDLNMEMGVLIEDEGIGNRIDNLFSDLILNSVLKSATK